MNYMTQNTRYFFILGLLLLSPLGIYAGPADNEGTEQSEEKKSGLEYENAFDLMKEFLDLEVKKEKPIEFWAKQLIGLIKQKGRKKSAELLPFVREFHRAYKTRNALGVGMALKNHKDRFGEPDLVKFIEGRIKKEGLNSLLGVLKYRLQR